MSLTRNQWIEMWETVKMIEAECNHLKFHTIHLQHIPVAIPRQKVRAILKETVKIKNAIESVIGQME